MTMSPEEREEAARRELFAVLAHELRSPIGAILGFEELLSEGILGDIPERGADALGRIRGSARQLLDLVAGLSDLALHEGSTISTTLEQVDSTDLIRQVVGVLEPEADGRGTKLRIDVASELPVLHTDPDRARRAIQLATMAAIKASAEAALDIRVHAQDGELHVHIDGSRLDPRRDDPDISLHHHEGAHLTGAGLRLGMARRALAGINGHLRFRAGNDRASLHLTIPSLHAR